jgi:hypothetical protein
MRFLIIFVISLILAYGSAAAKSKWSTDLKPGDKVCLYDIGKNDLLVGHDSYSLEYWYRSPAGNQKSRRQLRPSVRKLLFRVLWPGVTVNGKPDKEGNWYSATLVVIKKGYETKSAKPALIKRGENTLILEDGRSWAANWQVLKFTNVRLVKKPLVGNCRRKYEVY